MKPIIYNITAFDSCYEKVIAFNWQGNQAFKNTCIVRNNQTNSIVYNGTQETFQLSHTIPSYKLQNGTLYNITIKVIDKDGILSEESNSKLFYCYTTPDFGFSNLIDNQIIRNSSYELDLRYQQAEGEELQYYQVHIYNLNKNEIWTSGIKFDTSVMNVVITDLEDNGTYFIRASGSTINEMIIDTGYIPFSVDYIVPNSYAIITLENKKYEGMIKIQSNIISIEGKYYGLPEEPPFIDDEYIDLSGGQNMVCFDEGFNIENDFLINLKGYKFNAYVPILSLSNGQKSIVVKKKAGTYESEGNISKTYFELTVPNKYSQYIIHSNYIDEPEHEDILSIWIKRKSDVYEVYVKNLSK